MSLRQTSQLNLDFCRREPVNKKPFAYTRKEVRQSLNAKYPEGIKLTLRRRELNAPMQNLKFERHVEVVGNLSVNREVIETAIAERRLVS